MIILVELEKTPVKLELLSLESKNLTRVEQNGNLNPASTLNFVQDCRCCRETSYRQRQITLTNCFNSDGVRLSGEKGSMAVTVNEPVDCKCHECGKKFDSPKN